MTICNVGLTERGGYILKIMRKIIHDLKRESGFVSVETVFAMSFVIIVFLLVLGFFTFVQPYTKLDREVHALAQLAQRQGGLTLDDVQNFEEKLAGYEFVNVSRGDIEVFAHTIPGDMDAIGVDGLEEAGQYYVKRDQKEFIELIVTVPSHNEVLKPVANFFKVGGLAEKYTFKETFMSERY